MTPRKKGEDLICDVKPLSGLTDTWRIFYEESASLNPVAEKSDCEELRGKGDTRIYVWGMVDGILHCCVSIESKTYVKGGRILERRNRVYEHLAGVPGIQRYSGCVLRFPASMLDVVATAIKARKRRQITQEERERLRKISPFINPSITLPKAA